VDGDSRVEGVERLERAAIRYLTSVQRGVAREKPHGGSLEQCDGSVPRICRSVEQDDAFEHRGDASLE
jgi:hypothetical protein